MPWCCSAGPGVRDGRRIADKRGPRSLKFNADDMLAVLESQARDGVDFFTIHAFYVTRECRPAEKETAHTAGGFAGGAILFCPVDAPCTAGKIFLEHLDKS